MEKSKKEQLAEFHRNNIIKSAKKLILLNGMYQTTMDDIAKEAGYSKPTLYVYFSNRDEIINHIVYDNMVLLKNTFVESVSKHDNFEDAFLEIFRTHVFFQENIPLFLESMIGNITKKEDMSMSITQAIYKEVEEIHKVAFKLFEDGIAKKQVRPDIDILQTTFALWAAVCGIITMAYNRDSYIQGMKVERTEFIEYGFKLYLNSVLMPKK